MTDLDSSVAPSVEGSGSYPDHVVVAMKEKDALILQQAKRIQELEKQMAKLSSAKDSAQASQVAQASLSGDYYCGNYSNDKDIKSCHNKKSKFCRRHNPSGRTSATSADPFSCSCEKVDIRIQSAAIVIQQTYRAYRQRKIFSRLRSNQEEKVRRLKDMNMSRTSIDEESTRTATQHSCKQSPIAGDMKQSVSRLTTIDEGHCKQFSFKVPTEQNVNKDVLSGAEKLEQYPYLELSDSSDTDSTLDLLIETPLFDITSANFERVLECRETEGVNDSFNSDDSHDDEMTSRSSTLRSCDSYRYWDMGESSRDGTLRRLPANSEIASNESFCENEDCSAVKNNLCESCSSFNGGDNKLSCPSLDDSIDSNDTTCSRQTSLSGIQNAEFIRFRLPHRSPIWKRKSIQTESSGCLSCDCSSQSSDRDPRRDSRTNSETSSISNESVSSSEHHCCKCLVGGSDGDMSSGSSISSVPPSPTPHNVDTLPTARPIGSPTEENISHRIESFQQVRRKPDKGIQYLIENRFIDFRPNAVAKFLVSRKGLSRQKIGEYLGSLQSQFNMEVLRCFSDEIDLTGLELDEALRTFQAHFHISGEAQKIERLMEVFACRHCTCNPDQVAKYFRSSDTVFLLAFAIIMLNTDLHNSSIRPDRKMTKTDFIKNLRGLDDSEDIDPGLLAGIYERVKAKEFKPSPDHVFQVLKVDQMIVGKKLPLAVSHRRLVCYCRLYEIPDISKQERLGAHQRELFLFNDTLVITKLTSKKKKNSTYTYRQSFSLSGMAVYLFETPHYKYGVRLNSAKDSKVLITMCARNDDDRTKFVDDLRESILEMDEMEAYLAKEKTGKSESDQGNGAWNRYSKDSGVVDIDATYPPSNPNNCECIRKNSLTSSFADISDRHRTGSRGSLDSGMSSTGSGSVNSCKEACKLGHSISMKTSTKPATNVTNVAAAPAPPVGKK